MAHKSYDEFPLNSMPNVELWDVVKLSEVKGVNIQNFYRDFYRKYIKDEELARPLIDFHLFSLIPL